MSQAVFARVWLLLAALALLLCPAIASAQERHRTFRVPFDTVNGLIRLDGQPNDKPAVLLLDTGANNSVVDVHSVGFNGLRLEALRSTGKAGAVGDCVVREVKLRHEHRSWLNRRVCVMDQSDVPRRIGTRIDGFIGADVLLEFPQVRINFEAHTLELEEQNSGFVGTHKARMNLDKYAKNAREWRGGGDINCASLYLFASGDPFLYFPAAVLGHHSLEMHLKAILISDGMVAFNPKAVNRLDPSHQDVLPGSLQLSVDIAVIGTAVHLDR